MPCIRTDCTCSALPTKLCIIIHNLLHQLLDQLLTDRTVLAVSQFRYRLCNCCNYFIGIDNVWLAGYRPLVEQTQVPAWMLRSRDRRLSSDRSEIPNPFAELTRRPVRVQVLVASPADGVDPNHRPGLQRRHDSACRICHIGRPQIDARP